MAIDIPSLTYQEVKLKQATDQILAQREEILTAFIAKYGIEPDQIEQMVYTDGKRVLWTIQKKQSTPEAA